MLWIFIVVMIVLLLLWARFDYRFGLKRLREQEKSDLTSSMPSSATLISDGEELFTTLFKDLAKAKHHIHIQFYIFRSDGIGEQMIQALCEKASNGVTTRLLIDRFGCKLSRSDKKKLKQAGVVYRKASPIKWPYVFFSLNRRNHRKLSCIDGKVGYIGGFNVGDEYLGRNPFFGYWRDYHVRLTGEGVVAIQTQFMRDFEKVDELPSDPSFFPPLEKGDQHVQFLSTQGVGLEQKYLSLIHSATESLLVGTPYFIPTKAIQKALLEACERGVQITILIPEKADHPFVKHGATPFLLEVIRAGAMVHHYYRGFYHVKAFIVDHSTCLIGTANFDRRSLHLNDEMSCITSDLTFISEAQSLFHHDLARSINVTEESLKQRPMLDRLKENVTKPLVNLL
ncbi:cardiolipin synthase [Shouchella sp. 1P09AA]|uniref:cardiolipin synthase n=1 Tax=unclassified Shouchella TaxID=2893065 RepID=UPI00399FD899